MAVRLVQYSDIEGIYDDPDRTGQLASTIRALDGSDALVVGTGDNTAPGVLPLVERGRQSIPFFRAIDTDLETFGNHDFDYGVATTREVIRSSPQTWVSVNVYDDGTRFGADVGVVPTAVRTVDGTRVGAFGVTDPRTASINPEATHLEFTDPYDAAADAVETLREQGVDLVVALSHLGSGDERLAVETDVDVVLGGHVHTERIERVDGTLLTRPGQGGHVVFEVTVDRSGTREVARHEVAAADVDAGLRDEFADRHRSAGLDEVVGRVEGAIERDDGTVFSGESRVGNFVADAYRWAMDAEIGLQNSGGIRSGPPLEGEVTRADLISLLPFDEPVAFGRVTGAELRQLLGEATGTSVGFDEPGWWHAQLGGARAAVDRDAGDVTELRVGNEPVDPDATYTIAASDYLFQTPDEFPTLTPGHRVRTGPKQYEALIEYARAEGIAPELEDRIVFR